MNPVYKLVLLIICGCVGIFMLGYYVGGESVHYMMATSCEKAGDKVVEQLNRGELPNQDLRREFEWCGSQRGRALIVWGMQLEPEPNPMAFEWRFEVQPPEEQLPEPTEKPSATWL